MSIKVSKRNSDKDFVYQLEGRLDTSGSAVLKLEFDMATANPTELEDIIRSTGFFQSKARNLIGMASICRESLLSALPVSA